MSNCCKNTKKCCGIGFHSIPAALGDDTGEFKPENGAYHNMLVKYEENGVNYLYSNDGIPTRMGDGIVATIEVGETTTLQPGESATVENTGDKYHAVLNFGIPEGQKGDTGDAATIEVGATTTSAPGSDASVTNSGDEHNAVLDFVIPRGSQGPQGVPGQAATIQVGTVTTLDPDQDATVVNSGTTSAAVFDFGIPKGDKGDTGSVSSEVVTELPVPGDDSRLYLMEKNPTVETADGAAFTIQNAANDGEMRLVELKGNATQNGTPTPDAPVAIQTVSGEQTVKITGKNLLNPLTFVKGRLDNGVVGYQEGTSVLEATATDITFTTVANFRGIISDYIQVVGGSKYTQNQQLTVDNNTGAAIAQYDSSKTFIRQDNFSTGTVLTMQANTAYTRIYYFARTSGTITLHEPQLELGSTATAYEPYHGQSHTIDLGSIELAKIGTTNQDKIYKSDGKWYLRKEVGKVVLSGSENWIDEHASGRYYIAVSDAPSATWRYEIKSDHFHFQQSGGGVGAGFTYESKVYLYWGTTSDNVSAFKTWLASNNTIVYYRLATPTTTEITDQTLIDQLEAIAELYGGPNYVSFTGTGAQGEIAVEYQTWEKYNRYDVYIWNDQIGDYQILNS